MGWPFRSPLGTLRSSEVVGGLGSGTPGCGLDTWLPSTPWLVPQQASQALGHGGRVLRKSVRACPHFRCMASARASPETGPSSRGGKKFLSLDTLNSRICRLTPRRAWLEGSVRSRLCFPPIYSFKAGRRWGFNSATLASADLGLCGPLAQRLRQFPCPRAGLGKGQPIHPITHCISVSWLVRL